MAQINCNILKIIQKDFNSLWNCKKRGNTIEISTPYLLPDSTLLSLFITQRKGKLIVHDGGSVSEVIANGCPFPRNEIEASLAGFSLKYDVKQCKDSAGQTVFFKECEKKSLISSMAFDLAAFATTTSNVLVSASYDEPDLEPDKRFQREADSYIKSALHSTGLEFKPRHEIREVPGVKFSAVIKKSNRIWVVSYVTGSTLPYFLRSVAVTNMNFEHVWQTGELTKHIGRTIPFLNTDANGYQPPKLKWQLEMLRTSSKDSLLKWTDRELFTNLLN